MRIIYLGTRNQYETMVSNEDYEFLMQWRWNFKISRGGNVYARRTAARSNHRNGSTIHYGFTLLMHSVIINRIALVQPSPLHTPDHVDGNTLNNQRDNLQWATRKEQALNRRHCRRRIGKRSELVYTPERSPVASFPQTNEAEHAREEIPF